MVTTTGTKRVLIADPSDKSRQALSNYLREKGLEIIEATDGSKALAETLLRRPDILLLDLSVPILAPERLIQILRSNPNTRSMPVFFLSDREQSVAMNRKNGILQVEAEHISGSVYIERGEIISAVTRNITGEKALFRLIPLKEGKFRFLPGKVGVRRTIFTPSQQAILEGMRHHDELRKLGIDLPHPDE